VELKAYLAQRRDLVDKALDGFLPDDADGGGELIQAMRYSLFAGGKRVRPILCLAGAEAVGGTIGQAMTCACAMEMIHTYSLIHDDLPAMDDDDYRRGKLTSHKVYGEGMAVLAGDGLLTLAAMLLCGQEHYPGVEPARVLRAANCVLSAAGHLGMVGGQALDLLAEGQKPELKKVRGIHQRKTGALIRASVESGAILGGGSDEQIAEMAEYGRLIGEAFQIADDLLDIIGDAEKLGKATGMDLARGKMTYPAVVGIEAAQSEGNRLVDEAVKIAGRYPEVSRPLSLLASYIMERTR
jgi:geranylgeranyl diphosphate synthase type II